MKTILINAVLILAAVSMGFGTTHIIASAGFTFSPDSLTVAVGDTITFSLPLMHNAAEVSFATWNADDTTRNGGFWVPFGGGSIVLSDTGTHFYVCQAHASLGMKGIIRAIPAPPPTNSLTIRNIVDGDGRISTTADRIARAWGLKLYKDSVGSGIILASAASDTMLSVDNLVAGTYVAVQADSPGWSHLGVSVDGVPKAALTPGQWPITLSSGESHAITFFASAPHTVINSGFTFLPDSILAGVGDTIHFVLELMHTAREVSASTWLADDTTSNGGFDLPFGGGDVVMTQLGTHYFVCVPHAFLGMKGRIIVASTVKRSIASGWNMVSVPVSAFDHTSAALFPSAISDAFSFSGSYQVASTLSPGIGYWLKFDGPTIASIDGFPIARDTVDVAKGWNMIGTISSPLAVAQIGSNPPGNITSNVFGYDGTYVVADTLVPGFGYWVKVASAGRLMLDSAAAAQSPLTAKGNPITDALATLTVSDAAGATQILSVIERSRQNAVMRASAELPPTPPEGAFDVRFTAGGTTAVLGEGEANAETFPISLSATAYPITVGWNVPSPARKVQLRVNGTDRDLAGSGSMSLPGPVRSLALALTKTPGIPERYSLDRPFPNPFNPTTMIAYGLPVESRVRLQIFNVLGQLIATLAEGVQSAGRGVATWNAAGMASGLYFVRLDASPTGASGSSFSAVTKVLLEK